MTRLLQIGEADHPALLGELRDQLQRTQRRLDGCRQLKTELQGTIALVEICARTGCTPERHKCLQCEFFQNSAVRPMPFEALL